MFLIRHTCGEFMPQVLEGLENLIRLLTIFTALSGKVSPYAVWRYAGPDGSFVSTGACNLEVPGWNPGRDGYLTS